MYAIVDFKGAQFKLEEGTITKVPFLSECETGLDITFNDVIFFSDGKETLLGTPKVKGISVLGTVLGHKKEKKIIVFKKKRRKGYQRKQGHRQDFTEIEVKKIIRGKNGS